jgi:hypothetical protein
MPIYGGGREGDRRLAEYNKYLATLSPEQRVAERRRRVRSGVGVVVFFVSVLALMVYYVLTNARPVHH